MTTFDHAEACRANEFEPWPGANNGRPSPEVEDWIINVLEPGKQIIANLLIEAMGTDVTADRASHFASAAVARLVHHDPPLTIERIP